MDYSRNIKILTWQGWLIGLNFAAPVIVIFFSKITGSYALGLSIFSIAMVCSAIFEVPTGIFSDLIGRKYTTMLGGLAYSLAYLAYMLGSSYWMLVVGAILHGLARSLYSGNNDALLYDSLNKMGRKAELSKYMGFIGSAEQWALGVSAVIGGMVVARYSYYLAMWISIIPLILCFVTSFWLVEVKNEVVGEGNIYAHLKEAWRNFVENRKLRLLSLSSIIGFGIGEAGFQFTTVFIAGLWPMWAIGIARMLSNIGAAIGFGWSGKIMKKFAPEKVLMFEQLSSKILSVTAYIFPTTVSPLLLSITSIMYGPSSVAESSIFQREFSDKQRATMGSLNSLGRSIFFAICAVSLGKIADITSPRIALIAGQVLGLISVYLTWKLFRLIKNEMN